MAKKNLPAIPHLLGQIDYSGVTNLEPDGDTVHLLNPVLISGSQKIKPNNGQLAVWVTGQTKPKIIKLKKRKDGTLYVPIRFEGIDAPEEHYRATPFTSADKKTKYPLNPAIPHPNLSQPRWKPATVYVLKVLEKAGWALVMLDREVTDKYSRVLGYVYASDSVGTQGQFISLKLVEKGLAFPFLFESSGELIPTFLAAAAKARAGKLGVWKHYSDAPLSYKDTYPKPAHYTDPEPAQQAAGELNLPMVFRRIVDAQQLSGLPLKKALQKYDAIDYETGNLVPGDQYQSIPIASRIWAPHSY
jgi:endonuclease YncB( thermonuclease family)